MLQLCSTTTEYETHLPQGGGGATVGVVPKDRFACSTPTTHRNTERSARRAARSSAVRRALIPCTRADDQRLGRRAAFGVRWTSCLRRASVVVAHRRCRLPHRQRIDRNRSWVSHGRARTDTATAAAAAAATADADAAAAAPTTTTTKAASIHGQPKTTPSR